MPKVDLRTRKQVERDNFLGEVKAQIKYFMVLSGIETQKDLAEKTGISEYALCRRMKNPDKLTLGELQAIYRACGKKIKIEGE